jgi:hypothetical protein
MWRTSGVEREDVMHPTEGIWKPAGGSVWTHKLVYLLLATVLLAKLNTASACSMSNPPNDEDLFARASTVFVGHIFRTEEIIIQIPVPGGTNTRAEPAVEGTFRLVEVLKGEPPADRKVVSSIPAMCVQWLMVGLDYLIFLDPGSNIIVSALDKGTRPLSSLSEQPVLGKLRGLSKNMQ